MNVLLKDFPEINKDNDAIFVADKEKIQNCIMFQGRRNRLQLQTDPKYDSIFNDLIINCESFADIDEPTKRELKLDDVETGDLIHAEQETKNFNPVAKMIYRWRAEVGAYIC